MNETAITQYITDTFADIDLLVAMGTTFFFYDPDHMFPFVTLVPDDAHDSFSDLNRPGVFRLNIGVSKQTYRSLFGAPPPHSDASGDGNSGYDFTALDQVMPHPVYGRQYWVCVLNPSDATFQAVVQPLLAEAYDLAVRKYGSKRAACG